MAKTKFGYMKCENRKCGSRVVVKINERETLSYTCDECDKSPYSKKGTKEHADWLSEIERAPVAPAPDPAPADKKDDKKTAEKKVGMWS